MGKASGYNGDKDKDDYQSTVTNQNDETDRQLDFSLASGLSNYLKSVEDALDIITQEGNDQLEENTPEYFLNAELNDIKTKLGVLAEKYAKVDL